ncbi:MAG: C45 family autoproteolytic acyltransferase/hydrolase [Kiritimatiellae bacterium]|nr:C45 family autoproteolytic acyltransferase/hydrolase [Kiritimatiellia bacterium]
MRVLLLIFVLLLSCAPLVGGMPEIKITARDSGGHGLLCTVGDKRVLVVEGTPAQMGAAHGRLMAASMPRVMPQTMALVGAAYTIKKGIWFHDKIDEIYGLAAPHTPARFIDECNAMADAAGIARRDVICGNFFPELFHCSGVAARNSATVGGQVVHARVLDYMRDINLQRYALVQVFIPKDGYAWISLGYAGLVGSVTAMNEHGLAIGEMGGASDESWNGMPMTFLMREVAERTKSVDEAVALMKRVPRTCEYYYVISDAGKNMVGIRARVEDLMVLQPGEQHELLPPVPADTVMFSGGSRAKKLSERLHAALGKIDAQTMIEIIKRPVAMKSNLHNAIFLPETLDMWVADAGKKSPACDEPYTMVNLRQIIEFYKTAQTSGADLQ